MADKKYTPPSIEDAKAAVDEAGEILMNARCKLLTTKPWYGTMCSLIDWKESRQVPTMGVRMMAGGRVECLWSPLFVAAIAANRTDAQNNALIAVLIHEVEHVVRMHIVRGGTKHPELFNWSCDAVLNGPKERPRIKKLPPIPIFNKDGEHELDAKGKPKYGEAVYFPTKNGPPQESSSEEVYKWARENIKCPKCGRGVDGKGGGGGQKKGKGQKGGGQGDQDKQKGGGCDACAGGMGDFLDGVLIDDHSIWDTSTADSDEARQVVRDMVQQSTSAGDIPGHLVGAIEALKDPQVNWKSELKQYVGRKLGGKRKTYARRSRRHDTFGVPGKSNHASVPLTLLVDTSGSVSDELIKQFFAEIESMSAKFKITVVQFDHAIQAIDIYHRGDWRKIKIHGRGGTSFDIAINGIIEHSVVGRVNIILTDGYAGFPEPPPFPVLWCINTDVEPPWGRKIQLSCRD